LPMGTPASQIGSFSSQGSDRQPSGETSLAESSAISIEAGIRKEPEIRQK
jgi:hypothetical protein